MGQLMDEAKAFIDALPEDGACIVTITNGWAKWLANGIRERCGREFLERCRVIGINRQSSVVKLIGEHRRVVLYPSFIRSASPQIRGRVEELAAGCNAMHPTLR